jgi:hypothetical protein
MPVAGGPFIQKTGILLEVDAADKTSYSGTGTTWINQITPGTFNGTLNNVTFNSSDANGALVFTGSNTFVDFGNLGSSLTSSFSFQVAFKPAPTASGQPYTILSYASASATSSFTFKLDYTSSNQTVVLSVFSTGSGAARAVHTMSGSANSGSWNIVHGTFGSAIAVLYVNGLGQAYAETTGSVVGYNTSNRLYAGLNFGSTSSYYSGSIANIIVNNADLDGLAVNKNYNAIASRFSLPVRRPLVTDFDAYAFVDAAGITDATQQVAINNLVIGLKGVGLWTKMAAVYPLVGGTAFSHKWNLKDPRDLDAAYRILWSGAITHDSNGIFTNSGGFGDTRFAPFTALADPLQSNHLSLYNNRGNIFTGLADMGNTNNNQNGMVITVKYVGSDPTYFSAYNASATLVANTVQNGLYVATRTSTAQSNYYRRGGQTDNVSNTSSPSASPRTANIYLLQSNPAFGSGTKAMAFATIGLGLTQTDVDNYYTVVQAYQTTLGRQA